MGRQALPFNTWYLDIKSKDCAENSENLNNVDTADELQHLTE
jgi:hypothetical protein